MNLASIAGEIAAPGFAVYGATKAGVIHFTRSVNAELEGDGVRATALCPGFVDTPGRLDASPVRSSPRTAPRSCGYCSG